jgi:hypothetical protein
MLLDPSGIDELLKEIHHSFGGMMYVDGRLCFRDLVQIEAPNLDPRNGEIRVLPRLASGQLINQISWLLFPHKCDFPLCGWEVRFQSLF